MIAQLVERLVRVALVNTQLVVGLSIAAALISGLYLYECLTIRTDLDALISSDLPWRKTEASLEDAFVSQGDDLTLVVDGPTPEQADRAADQLTDKLAERPDLFSIVRRPDGGPFLEQEALLFLTVSQLQDTTRKLIEGQPFLGPLAADPSLRGVMTAIDTSLMGADQDSQRLAKLAPVLTQIDDQLINLEAHKRSVLSWRRLISGEETSPTDVRKLVTLIPKIDYRLMQPAAPAMTAIAQAMNELGLNKGNPHQPTVKVTGSVAMEADELASLTEATGPIAIGSLIVMLAILYWGVRSIRVIGAIVATLATGLSVTTAIGILVFHRLTLVSVAFMPLFVGLSIDFAIQFAVRYRTEARLLPDMELALLTTGRTVGPGIVLAAAAIGCGFLAFWPTAYMGVSELGMIAGIGMIVGAILALTLLPAWLKLLNAGSAASDEGLLRATAIHSATEERKWIVLSAAGGTILVGLLLLPYLRTDFDLISLRSRKSESVSTFLEMTRDPDLTPNRLQVLAPNITKANAMASRIRALKTVRDVYTASSLIPDEQKTKLAIIDDASLILDTTLSPFEILPAPSDQETTASLRKAAASLQHAAKSNAPEDLRALSLASHLERLAAGPESSRLAASASLTASLEPALNEIRIALTARPVTIATLPTDVRRDWISAKGQARIEITPSGDPASPANLQRFVESVRKVAKAVSGPPEMVVDIGRTILGAFVKAGILSSLFICALLYANLRRVRDVALTIAPVLATFVFTLATIVAIGQPINPENLIALPLLLAIGVSFNIYSVVAWRDGSSESRRASLSHAILFSALTTGASFTTLALSAHPGTASMGQLLLISLFWTVTNALILEPALLATVKSWSWTKLL